MLTIRNVTKTFGTKKVLDDIDVMVEKGTIAVFLGESGVGKSTLLRVLNNLETCDAGEIYLDDKKLDLSQVNKTQTIGMVFQQFNLFEHLTVEQNIMLTLEKVQNVSSSEARAIANQLLTRFGLADKKNKYPEQLSGGQKQRLALTRTLATKPDVVCLDEPTSALDPLLTTHIANTISDLAKEGYTILIATHDTALLDKLDCMIYLMQHGKIIESASSKDFQKKSIEYPHIKKFVAGIIE